MNILKKKSGGELCRCKVFIRLALLMLFVSALPQGFAEDMRSNTAGVANQKAVLGRLLTELQHSPRSFVYLRSRGFTQSDDEFDQIIADNSSIFRRTRIVRRDEHGNRQIPRWPGVTLTQEYKTSAQIHD